MDLRFIVVTILALCWWSIPSAPAPEPPYPPELSLPIFVSTLGNDERTCEQAMSDIMPLKTLGRAMKCCIAIPSKYGGRCHVYMAPGTYYDNIVIPSDTTLDGQGHAILRPTIDWNANSFEPLLTFGRDAWNVVIQNMTLIGSGGWGFVEEK